MREQTGSKWICALAIFISAHGLTACIADPSSGGSGDTELSKSTSTAPGLREKSQSDIPKGCLMEFRSDLGKDVLHCPEKTPPPPP